jgi:hypothetical protein
MRYLRNIVLMGLLLTAFLPAAWKNKLVFQGNVNSADGYGYTGPLTVGVKIFANEIPTNSESTVVAANDSVQYFSVHDGIYTMELTFTDVNMDTLMAQDDLYLEIHVTRTAGVDNILDDNNSRLLPRMHLLGTPMALKVRGVNIKHNNNSTGGSNFGIGTTDENNPNGLSVASGYNVGVGTATPNANLHVSGNSDVTDKNKFALKAPNIRGTKIEGTAVHNVKWE